MQPKRMKASTWLTINYNKCCLQASTQTANSRLTVKLSQAHTHTHTRLTALCPGLPGWAGTRKVKPIWILLEQETVSSSGISWAICKSAPRPRQITMPAPHYSPTHNASSDKYWVSVKHVTNNKVPQAPANTTSTRRIISYNMHRRLTMLFAIIDANC